MTATGYFGEFNYGAVGTTIYTFGLPVASCGIQPLYGDPSYYSSYTDRVKEDVYRSHYNVDWRYHPARVTQEIEFTAEVKQEPKRNPNGYRQRKLKAKLNQMK